MVKVLISGRGIPHQPDRCTAQQLVRGFVEAGHEAVFYGNFYGEPYRWVGVEEATTQSFDLIIVTEMNDGYGQYDFKLSNLKDVPKIYWDFDISYNEAYGWQRAGAHRYDGYLVGNKLYVEKFAEKFKKPALHLPYACSPTIHRRKYEIAKQTVVGFVGSMTPERQALIGNIRCIHGVFGEALIDATNELYTMVHINQNACKGLVPGRPWETAGCGTNLLMDRASYDDFKEFLGAADLDLAVSVFDTPDEINNYAVYWWEHTADLRESGERLMNYMHTNHSYKNRAEAIIIWAKEKEILR